MADIHHSSIKVSITLDGFNLTIHVTIMDHALGCANILHINKEGINFGQPVGGISGKVAGCPINRSNHFAIMGGSVSPLSSQKRFVT